jgi:RNA polymerase sigma-70 factor (ECF subfamily)
MKANTMDEQALIQDARSGDLDSYNRLVLAYQDMAYNLAFRMLGDSASADDATQEAFISAWHHIDSYRGGSFKAWIYRIVTNSCYDELRKRQRHPEVPIEPVNDDDEEMESAYWMADTDPTPEETVEQKDLNVAIQNCLNQLPDEFRSVVLLVDIEGMDYEEVSKIAVVPLGTIKSRLARGRLKLRFCLRTFRELLPSALRLKGERS